MRLSNEQQQHATEERDFPLLEEGTYIAVLNKVVEKPGKQAPYWEWEFQIVGTPDGEEIRPAPRVWERTSLSPLAVWRVRKLLLALGGDLATDTEDLVGTLALVAVEKELIEEGARAGQMKNVLADVISPLTEE
jgi:hypothetical protein